MTYEELYNKVERENFVLLHDEEGEEEYLIFLDGRKYLRYVAFYGKRLGKGWTSSVNKSLFETDFERNRWFIMKELEKEPIKYSIFMMKDVFEYEDFKKQLE